MKKLDKLRANLFNLTFVVYVNKYDTLKYDTLSYNISKQKFFYNILKYKIWRSCIDAYFKWLILNIKCITTKLKVAECKDNY